MIEEFVSFIAANIFQLVFHVLVPQSMECLGHVSNQMYTSVVLFWSSSVHGRLKRQTRFSGVKKLSKMFNVALKSCRGHSFEGST